MRTTYTFVTMEVSHRAYTEIRAKMAAAEYDQAFLTGEGGEMIDMHGLALVALEPPPPKGTLMVGLTEKGDEIVINHPDLETDADGTGHIIFSPEEATHLANVLLKRARQATATKSGR